MKFKKKGWIWKLSIFATNNYTTVWDTIYGPYQPSRSIIEHEQIHYEDQKKWGKWLLPAWIFCYLFCFPLLWNPLRWKTEYRAYIQGSGLTGEEARKTLRGWRYGWLLWH